MSEGVDAWGGHRRRGLGCSTAPRGALQSPYNARARILSGSLVPDGLRGPGTSYRVRARPDKNQLAGCACRGRLDRNRTYM